MTQQALSPLDAARQLSELWSPKVIGEVDDFYVKVAKVKGTFTWHAHDDQDELFLVLAGRLAIEMEENTVELGAGEMYVVPKGVRHNPRADEECLLMLFERKDTLHTGEVMTERTRSIEEQLG